MSDAKFTITVGDRVIDSDGHQIGRVIFVHEEYFLMEKGVFFLIEYRIPRRWVANVNLGMVFLTVPSAHVLKNARVE